MLQLSKCKNCDLRSIKIASMSKISLNETYFDFLSGENVFISLNKGVLEDTNEGTFSHFKGDR